jgi:hypothetical protein
MRFFYIFCLILLSSFQTKSQTHSLPLQDGEAVHVKFYPNPATSAITFDFLKDNDKLYSFQIFNFLGKKVYESSSVNSRTIVNLTDFTRGIYIFQLKDQNGKVIESGKFQVNK